MSDADQTPAPGVAEVVQLLRASDVFKDVPEADLEQLAAGFEPRSYPAGEVVVREGERGTELFLVTSGTFDVFAKEADGRRRLDTLGAGALFGEMAALTGGRRYATVQAAEESEALVNEESRFHDVLRSSRVLSEAILRSLDRYA